MNIRFARAAELSDRSARHDCQLGINTFTDGTIGTSPDCAKSSAAHLSHVLDCLIDISDEQKMRILRRHDKFRQWQSLDEKRYCLHCGEIITGRQIRVIKNGDGAVTNRLACPTGGCDSTPIEWVEPTEDVLVKMAMVQLECRHRVLITRAAHALRPWSHRPKRLE